MRVIMTFGLAASVLISGCVTTPDPAEVCTAEWIKPRAERAVNYLERDTKRIIKSLKKSAAGFEKGETPGLFQILALSSSVEKLMKELKSGRAIKDLRILRDTCNDPNIIEDALTDFMKDQGLPSGLIDFVKTLEPYKDLMEKEFGTKTVTS